MTAWGYPGPENRGENWKPLDTQRRWSRPEWKSLAWATQLLAALGVFFVVLVKAPVVGDAVWWLAMLTEGIVFVLVSVLAVRR